MIEVESSKEHNSPNDDSGSSVSDELNQDELMNMHQHLRVRRSGRTVRMSAEMQAIYKQALMHVIFGQFLQAAQKLKHLITSNPDNPEPYHLMGTMYEETGDLKKAVEYFLLSTYLSPPSFQKWAKVADMSMELKIYPQAAYCYGRALKIDNYNVELSLKRAQAFELSNQERKAVTMYKRILKATKSLLAIKRYARLKFKKGQYSKARQILMNFYEDRQKPKEGQQEVVEESDQNLLYMICETLLKQEKYIQLGSFILDKIVYPNSKNSCNSSESLNIDSIPLEFLRMLYIAYLAQFKTQMSGISFAELEATFYDSYEQSDSEQYEEAVKHLIKINQQKALKLLLWLLEIPKHQSVDNYLLASQFLKKQGRTEQATEVVHRGTANIPGSAQLQAQGTYLKVLSGKRDEPKGRKEVPISDKYKPKSRNLDAIFYSDDDDMSPDQSENHLTSNIKASEDASFQAKGKQTLKRRQKHYNRIRKSRNKTHIQTHDENIVCQLLQNTNSTMKKILEHITLEKQDLNQNQEAEQDRKDPAVSYFKDVYKSIQLIVELSSEISLAKQQTLNSLSTNDSILSYQHRRRRMVPSVFIGHGLNQSRPQLRSFEVNKLIKDNLELITMIIQLVIQYQIVLLRKGFYRKVIMISQQLSKASFLRRHLRNQILINIKIRMYEIAVLACLHAKKFGRCLFFMRYLINKQPKNEFYVLLLSFLARKSPKKNCLGSMFRKFIMNKPREGQELFNLLLAFQHLQTSQYEISMNLFLEILNQQNVEWKYQVKIFLCSAASFLQLASSRTTFNKLDNVNRSAFFMKKYVEGYGEQSIKSNPEVMFNLGRWNSQIKAHMQAIFHFQRVLSLDDTEIILTGYLREDLIKLKKKAALCLMIIFRDINRLDRVSQLSQQYFPLQDQLQSET